MVQADVTVRASSQEEALVRAEATEVSALLRDGTAVRTIRIGGVPVNLMHGDGDADEDGWETGVSPWNQGRASHSAARPHILNLLGGPTSLSMSGSVHGQDEPSLFIEVQQRDQHRGDLRQR